MNTENHQKLYPEIIQAIESDEVQMLCEEKDFWLQKGSDKLKEFENFNMLSSEKINDFKDNIKNSSETPSEFLKKLDINSNEYKLLVLLNELVSYCDLNAADKDIYNKYDDRRTMAKSGINQSLWTDILLRYKAAGNDIETLSPSTKNAILYLKDPENGLTMLASAHREEISKFLLKVSGYKPQKIIQNIISFFEPYKISIQNKKNITGVYCRILYSEAVASLWLNTQSEIDLNNTKTMKKLIPLNQIFYGPPGTGKTYNISSEAEKIINASNNNSANTREEKFNRICQSVRNITDLEIKGNSLYRNERAISWMFGYLLEPPHDTTNSITRSEAIKNGMDPSPSSWSQYSQYITQFGFVENWKKSTEINLNARGIKLKDELKAFLIKNNLSFKDLKKWDQDAPSIVKESYFGAISEIVRNDFTDQMKVIYCILNLALNNCLRSENEYKKKDPTDRKDASTYIDIEDDKTDIKWIGQIGRTLNGLGFVDDYTQDSTGKKTYYLSEYGNQLVDKIIENWERNYPELFGEFLNYENAIKHDRIRFITFHQSYSYEEFIEGIKPKMNSNELTYSLEDGVFKAICNNAKNSPNHNYVIIIDEINRGNISKIFGELITLIEASKRLNSGNPKEHPKQVTLPYSKKLFGVPKNLYILGTMNTADKSIALLDAALRRRFSFTEMLPESKILTNEKVKVDGIEIEKLLDTINKRIEFLIDKDHTIGHSYFLKIKENQTIEALAILFRKEIIPLLTEYFYGDFKKIQLVLGDNKDWKAGRKEKFFKERQTLQNKLFGKAELIEGYDEKEIFELEEILAIDENGGIKGSTNSLVNLFKSVYTPKSE